MISCFDFLQQTDHPGSTEQDPCTYITHANQSLDIKMVNLCNRSYSITRQYTRDVLKPASLVCLYFKCFNNCIAGFLSSTPWPWGTTCRPQYTYIASHTLLWWVHREWFTMHHVLRWLSAICRGGGFGSSGGHNIVVERSPNNTKALYTKQWKAVWL